MALDWNKISTSKSSEIEIGNKDDLNHIVKNEDDTLEVSDFVPRSAKKRMEDLIVTPVVRNRIETALNRILYHDTLYNKWNLQSIDPFGMRTIINLFGPPGTGKTFCAEAIANHLNKQIIDVNYAEIESKYVGETSKNIVEAFKQAGDLDAVLFFDEADSILGKRMTNVTQSSDHSVNVSRAVMLKQLDSFDGIVIFATNLAQNYDSAFVRRILAHIEFELPNEENRIKLWKYLLVKEIPIESEVSLKWLAAQSDGLSGGDLLNVVISASGRAVARKDDEKRVSKDDLLDEIKSIKNAKQKVGNPQQYEPNSKVHVTETDFDSKDLPEDVKEKYEEIVDINS